MNGKQLKNSILQWAIQGKLVPQDPNDEPASVLLEKIRGEKERLIKEKKIKRDKNASIIYRGEDNSYYEKILATGDVKCIDDEIPFEIPQGWEWCRIRNISQSYIGLTYSPSEVSPQGTIVLRSSNIKDGRIVFDDIVRVTKNISEKLLVEKNDIIICARNGSAKLVGKSAIVTEITGPMTFGAFMAICKTSLYQYVSIFLQSDLFFSQLRGVSGTTTINQLTQNNFNGFLIAIPPLEEQHRIFEKINDVLPIVEIYGNKQEQLNKLNDNLRENVKKSILQEAIQGRLVQQIAEESTVQELLKQIKAEKQKLVKEGKLKKSALNDSVIFRGADNKYYEQIGENCNDITDEIPFDLPYNWCWCRFSNIVSMTIGKTPARGEQTYWINGKYNWVSISDMVDGGSISTTKEKVSDLAVKEVFSAPISEKGSLLMSFKLSIGKTSILDIDAYHNEAIITIRPVIDKEYAMRNYLFKVLPLIANLGESKDAIKGKTLNSKSLSNLLIPLPPLQEQQRIIKQMNRLSKQLR